jgi:hypothetical protein
MRGNGPTFQPAIIIVMVIVNCHLCVDKSRHSSLFYVLVWVCECVNGYVCVRARASACVCGRVCVRESECECEGVCVRERECVWARV